MPGEVPGDEALIAPLARLIPADEPASIGRIRLDHPQRRMLLLDVVVGIHTPHLVRPADEINSQPGQNVRRIVQRLREVLDAAPHEHMQRTRVIAPGAADDPLGTLRRRAEAGSARTFQSALLRDRPQRIRSGILAGMGFEIRVVAFVGSNDFQNVFLASRTVGRGN
jgi:hypothetical protein